MKNSIKSPTIWETRIIKLMVLLGLFSILNFFIFFFDPDHGGNLFLFSLLSITVVYGAIKKLYMWYNYSNISVPESPEKEPEFKVDILTTYFPGEPYQMIVTTLEAISKITYPHTTYLCDEANDSFLKKFCLDNGVVHVTRNNRKDAKAGNINNALEKVATGDICVVLDPDHIPDPDFLNPILPYFSNPEIGFVQIVQSYYNIKETLVARGAAEQTYQFYGPMMMTLNSYGTVNAIGANCVFRRTALDSIGGHAPGLCEDMHTAMLLYSRGWKAVYLPEVLARGLAPSSLTTYFKQQLKWARGTFDLLLKVYPKIFSKLSVRQKIHFGILPLHYLCGLIYFINFLIPILALFLSTTPWRGNIVEFVLAILPVGASALLIRAFVQKWVIEKEERGFHVVGGLLQINTWWIYLVALFYTIINKDVPYLPTPKQSEFDTNLKIVIPNAIVAFISVAAIIYGLFQDLTPFSMIMAGFAFFNALIMLFGIYLTVRVTNQNRILRNKLEKETVSKLWRVRMNLREIFHKAFTVTRRTAVPLLVFIILFTLGFKQRKSAERWENVSPVSYHKTSGNFLGIYHPPEENGLIDMEEINTIEARQNINFGIISFYLAWNEASVENFPMDLLQQISDKNAIPMITWEPWISELSETKDASNTFRRIAAGEFDNYIRNFANHLANFDRPIFLRFAHEFDNPQYPWHLSEGNTTQDFIDAWKHIHDIIEVEGAKEVMLVWNPWRPENLQQNYPGDDYVDWIGVTLLNYGPLNQDGKEFPFAHLYKPFHDKFWYFTRKPVMLSEFGSVDMAGEQTGWLRNAMNSMSSNYPEIDAVVLFNSAFDNNIPENDWYKQKYIDWRIDSINVVSEVFERTPLIQNFHTPPLRQKMEWRKLPLDPVKGVQYKKGEDWKDNYYVLTRETVLKDFQKMKRAGLNTIFYKGGNIYEYNVLKYAEQSGLKVIYEFNLKPSTGFLNPKKLENLEKEIVDKAQELKDNSAVIGFSFNLDLNPYFEKPLLFSQRKALIQWLQPILNEIKQDVPKKSIIVELPFDDEAKSRIEEIDSLLPVDLYGVALKDEASTRGIIAFERDLEVPLLFNAVGPELYLENHSPLVSQNVIFQNWQDERLSYRLTLDGLVDRKGRIKEGTGDIEELWKEEQAGQDENFPVVKILKPAVPLLAGENRAFHAEVYFNGHWIAAKDIEPSLSLEWSLVKNDIYGNHLAVKELGRGNKVTIKVPAEYENYELLLTITNPDNGQVRQVLSNLHTPLE